MKINTDQVYMISPTQSRILTAIEQLLKNHDIAPEPLVRKVSNISTDFTANLKLLVKNKFLRYYALPYVGYSVSINGYDCLAINTLRKRGLVTFGDKIGIGKESDIFYGEYKVDDKIFPVALKFARLGRTSFRNIKNLRDYHGNRKHCSWNYLSRISAEREKHYLDLFADLAVPKAYDQNRHVIVMELLDYTPLYQVKDCDCDKTYKQMMDFIETMYKGGYIHGDFNEFNIMINENNEIKIIDFPQCIEITDNRAYEYLKRDIMGVKTFFEKKYRYTNDYMPDCGDINIENFYLRLVLFLSFCFTEFLFSQFLEILLPKLQGFFDFTLSFV